MLPLLALSASAADFSAEGLEFFEKRIRPVLVERCYKCHSSESEKLKGELRLDSREGALKGGESGKPAFKPGEPQKSLLIEAIRYGNVDLQMPPKGKLPDEQIADFEAWVKLGAPWPKSEAPKKIANKKEFNLAQRKQEHWCWQPIHAGKPPAVADTSWPRSPVDHFILAKLEEKKIKPASPTGKRTLIRRLSFDLIGLPPTPAEVEEFVSDSSPGAYERVVNRLLASPHFGERWARHWLDLMRYSETLGHEFDYAIPNAWRYRDYVIRAFNDDLPYDQFAIEHIAGDLLDKPRRHPTEGFNESQIGTAFYWFSQQTHSPVDARQHQADLFENQIDVLTKTFLGLTVACARCHDHKFDAISTRDYYSLYGVMGSSRYAQRAIDSEDRIAPKIEQLQTLKSEIRKTAGRIWTTQAQKVGQYLLATRELKRSQPLSAGWTVDAVATQFQLDARLLERWLTTLERTTNAPAGHPLQVWRRLANSEIAPTPEAWNKQWQNLVSPTNTAVGLDEKMYFKLADFGGAGYANWFPDGEAFGKIPSAPGDFMVGQTNQPVAAIFPETVAHSGALSRQLQGALRSPTFTITNRYLHLLAAGRDSRLNVFLENFALIQDPIYGTLRRVFDRDELKWLTIDLNMWQGRRAYLEFSDIPTPDLAGGGRTGGYGTKGFVAVSRVALSDTNVPPAESSLTATMLFGDQPTNSIEALAERYQRVSVEAVGAWLAKRTEPSAQIRALFGWLDWLVENGLLVTSDSNIPSEESLRLAKLLAEYRHVEASLSDPVRVPGMTDGNGVDDAVFVRGNHRTLGESAPRRFLTALVGSEQSGFKHGSGRLELARNITDPANSLTARVMVNRIWHHLFGVGIVPTVDNFGVLGQPPTHPELLDWLAAWFQREGWSTKKLVRLLVTSRAYQMSSQPADALAEDKDPNNDLLHRMRLQRMEGETMRDAMLFVSGRLDPRISGPSAPIYLTPFMDGRGRPGSSGPLDGAGRRSLYVELRRNFLSPMMLAFDTPIPATTVGKRSSSNVPAQALILMNDPFVVEQAKVWAKRLVCGQDISPQQRITQLYLSAFSRPPSESELSDAMNFLIQQSAAYGASRDFRLVDERVWADLCHVLFNVKEFVFVN